MVIVKVNNCEANIKSSRHIKKQLKYVRKLKELLSGSIGLFPYIYLVMIYNKWCIQ